MIEGLIARLKEKKTDFVPSIRGRETRLAATNSIFLVHGRNEGIRGMVARFLEHLDLHVIILHEQPDRGRTVIEKFEGHSAEASFAVVLLTADDRGGLKEQDPSAYRLRARQNVIFEFGFFIGALTRSQVCALYEEGIEIPSDYQGVLFAELNSDWKLKLARELREAGLPVDLNKALSF
jgi:predicted nucleotide-binding protein